jgi:crotonobetaine/carnitine-CoA ligase
MGKVAPGYEMLVVTEDGTLAGPGEMGEVWIRGVRGISVFLEYLNNPEANEKMFTDDGWCRTGDIVRLEAGGNVFYCDRDKDALKVGGENVSAREVEDVRAAGAPLAVAVAHPMPTWSRRVRIRRLGAGGRRVRRSSTPPPESPTQGAAVYFVQEFPTAGWARQKKELPTADSFPEVWLARSILGCAS